MRKSHFMSPTKSSNQKATPQYINVKEKIQKLTNEVQELKQVAAVEDTHIDNLERINVKNYNAVNGQIKSLRKAFNTLADVVLEELETLKREFMSTLEYNKVDMMHRIDDLINQFYKSQTDKEEMKREMANQQYEKMKNMENLIAQQGKHFQEQLMQSRDETRVMVEKMKGIIGNNASQVEILTKEHERMRTLQLENKAQIESNFQSFNQLAREGSEKQRIDHQDAIGKILEQRNQLNYNKENAKLDTQNLQRSITELSQKVLEQNKSFADKINGCEMQSKQRHEEIDQALQRLLAEIQENIQELASVHKENSDQIITDFERTINSCNNETKLLYKKINSLENLIHTYKIELGQNITSQEHQFAKKTEQTTHAIFDICRQLKITNPLLNY